MKTSTYAVESETDKSSNGEPKQQIVGYELEEAEIIIIVIELRETDNKSVRIHPINMLLIYK